jgi:chromosome segregation ATPase
LKAKLTTSFLDIDAGCAVLSSDIVKIHDKITNMTEILGAHRAAESISSIIQQVVQRCQHLDEARSQMANQLSRALSLQDDLKAMMNSTVEEVSKLQAVTQQTETWISATDRTLDVFRQRFNHIKPFLTKLTSQAPDPVDDFMNTQKGGPDST